MTYDPATIYSFVRIRSLPRCSLQREWSTASKKKGEKKNVPLYIHIVKGVNRRFWRVDADGWAAPAIPVISTYVRTYVAGVCSISCISWRGAAACICSCFVRANYYTPLWRATRVENETERGGRGLRTRRSKGISSKYLRASINILHTSASPSPPSIHRTAISPSYSQTRFLERSSNNWEWILFDEGSKVSKLENRIFVPWIDWIKLID